MKSPDEFQLVPLNDWLTLDDLCDRTGESRRTVRFYILNGLLSAPVGQGPAARYPASHTLRLRVVRRMQDEGMQLSRIRQLTVDLDDTALQQLLDGARPLTPMSGLQPEPRPATPQIEAPAHASEGWRRSQWERLVLEPGVELHLCRPANTAVNRRIQKVLEFYKSLGR